MVRREPAMRLVTCRDTDSDRRTLLGAHDSRQTSVARNTPGGELDLVRSVPAG